MSIPEHPDVAIVGGGIIGLASARVLALRGARVVVLERGAPGREASAAAAGMLAPLSEVRTPGPLFEACRRARDAWGDFHHAVTEESGLEVEYDTSGAMITARGEDELATLSEIEQAAEALDEPARDLDPTELRRLVPDLDSRVERSLHLPGEHRVDNQAFLPALARAAEAAGTVLARGFAVTRLDVTGARVTVEGTGRRIQAGAVVVASGAWAGGPAGPLPTSPIRPVRGQMLRFRGAAWPWTGNVRVGGHYYGIRRGADGLLFGATLEEAGFDDRTTPDGLAELLAAFRRAFPNLAAERPVSYWSGLRPGTPDDSPILGRLGDGPVWCAGGHFRNGILLAPWTAERLVPWVLGEAEEPTAHPFSPGRFEAPAGAREPETP